MIIKPSDLIDNFNKLAKGETVRKGLSTGFLDLDENLKLAKSYMMILTGYPGSGKSEWLDAVLVNMTIMYNWKVMYFSPENHPVEQHMSKLAEKRIGKKITDFRQKETEDALAYLSDYFTWMYPENPELDTLIDLAKQEKDANGLDCLVIDPWNAVTHHRTGMLHEYLSEALSKIIRFARNNEVLVCIVAHPTKPQKDKDGNIPVPNLYDISDGAMWRNKADYGIVVHRPNMAENKLEIYIQKIKQKWMGQLGVKALDYNWINGRFKCPTQNEYLLPDDIESPF